MNSELHERYSRQILFEGIGEAGQERLLGASAVLVGCGALGTVTANLLARAGIGSLTGLVDRDFVEPSNLHRQSLFDDSGTRALRANGGQLPKNIILKRHQFRRESGRGPSRPYADERRAASFGL